MRGQDIEAHVFTIYQCHPVEAYFNFRCWNGLSKVSVNIMHSIWLKASVSRRIFEVLAKFGGREAALNVSRKHEDASVCSYACIALSLRRKRLQKIFHSITMSKMLRCCTLFKSYAYQLRYEALQAEVLKKLFKITFSVLSRILIKTFSPTLFHVSQK